jgi:AcrR family transcriptional regulator
MYKTRGDPFNAAVLMPQPLVAAVAPRGERRTDILLAAERLFARHGYRGVTIRQIAERAAVPLALVGYYFGPKHALFHAVFEPWRRTIDECLALLAQAGQGQSGGNRLRAHRPCLRRAGAAAACRPGGRGPRAAGGARAGLPHP